MGGVSFEDIVLLRFCEVVIFACFLSFSKGF